MPNKKNMIVVTYILLIVCASTNQIPRKTKVNKYEIFSQAPEDPLMKTIKRVNEDSKIQKMGDNIHIRGTTIPEISLPSNFKLLFNH
jgi:hypothetical protein